MNHNPHNLKKGDIVIADKNHRNGYKVVILGFTPNYVYATVHGFGEPETKTWEIMTSRLSPLQIEINKQKPQDKLQKEVECGANWQVISNGSLTELRCRHCGVYVTNGGTPKCLKK